PYRPARRHPRGRRGSARRVVYDGAVLAPPPPTPPRCGGSGERRLPALPHPRSLSQRARGVGEPPRWAGSPLLAGEGVRGSGRPLLRQLDALVPLGGVGEAQLGVG